MLVLSVILLSIVLDVESPWSYDVAFLLQHDQSMQMKVPILVLLLSNDALFNAKLAQSLFHLHLQCLFRGWALRICKKQSFGIEPEHLFVLYLFLRSLRRSHEGSVPRHIRQTFLLGC